jgi:RPA family protein
MEYQRHTAIQLNNATINENPLKLDEKGSTYLEVGAKKIYRVNVMGIVVQQEILGSVFQLVVDDGTGFMTVRFFEKHKLMEESVVGKSAILIGRVRDYNGKYLAPEIFKIIDPGWLKVRSATLTPLGSQVVKVEVEEETTLPGQKISTLIQKLDEGTGVLIEEIIERSQMEGTEQLINRMLEQGEIFQITPGKVKVL